MSELTSISISEIVPGDNDRQAFSEDALRELAESIQSIGLAQPITVRPLYQDGEFIGVYQIVAGERRFRACKLLGMTEIPAIIREMDDESAAALMLAENLQRVDISPLEAARAFKKRVDAFGWTVAEVAAHANVRPDLVTRRLKLLTLCPEAALLLDRQNIPIRHAEVMAGLDSNRQILALRLFQGSRAPSLSEFNSYCSRLAEEQSQELMFDMTEFELAIQQAEVKKVTEATAAIEPPKPLPAPTVGKTLADTFACYINDLVGAGHRDPARALANLYTALVCSNLPSPATLTC